MSEKPTSAAVTTSEHSALLKQALRALEHMKQKLAAAEQLAADNADARLKEPIAIVGMDCSFPGEARNPEAFWQLLQAGREAIREVPADRWDVDAYYDPDPTVPGKMVTRFGGFMDKIDEFDASFFGIAPREAAMMDPQQRLLLEVTWRALESGGIAPGSLAGSKTGMYLGIASGDYAQLQMQSGDPSLLDVHFASGIAHSTASGRLSYLLGLKGPSLSLDTACSSSLVAVHLACQALRTGECSLAIAGGVNLILAPETTVVLSQAHMLAPDGRSKAFDDAADGFARAEGCGVVVLKPLKRALADGDRVLAVIRGTAVNQDGASSSLTAPNGPSQEELMRAALENAGLDAARVGYVEAHGTGTPLGDPIELRALGAVYGVARRGGDKILVGSLKTNFGHMEAAAGIGGLIKLVLSLRHGEVPAHLQFETPTRHVNWEALRLAVTQKTLAWPEIFGPDGKPALRVGAVSSFGFSGTNAHLVVEQAPESPIVKEVDAASGSLLPVSARSPEALRDLVAAYEQWLEGDGSGASWPAIAVSAGLGRDHFRYRTAIVAGNQVEAAVELKQLASRAEFGKASTTQSLCFLFTGQGSERPGMGLELLAQSKVFRAAVERLDSALAGSLGMPIAAIWAGNNGELQKAGLVQPALYAYGWALSELWRSLGVEPSVVMGHSLGEYAASTVAGVMTPEEGIRLVAARGRLTETLAEPGGMVAVAATLEAVRSLLAPGLSVAAVNGPASVVISGRLAEIEAFEHQIKASGLRHKRLRTTHGFHSAALEPMLDAFEAEAAKVAFQVPEVRWISNVTGQAIERKRPIDAAYWRRHLRETVEFAAGLGAAELAGATAFVELGIEPQLLALAVDNGIDAGRQVASIAKSGADGEWRKILTAAGRLYGMGVSLDWKGLHPGPHRRVELPGYPFERRRFWFNEGTRAQASDRISKQGGGTAGAISGEASGHPLLGSRLLTHSETVTFQARLSPTYPAHLGDHVVLGRRILPGAAYLEMAMAAGRSVSDASVLAGWTVADVEFREACVFDEPRLLETVLYPAEASDGRRRFAIASTSNEEIGEWAVHAVGVLEPAAALAVVTTGPENLAAVQDGAQTAWERDGFYSRFEAAGLHFGAAFQPVLRAWGGSAESLVEFEFPPGVIEDASKYVLSPVVLDACLQSAAALVEEEGASNSPRLPAALARYSLVGDVSALRYGRALVRSRQGRGLTVDIEGLTADGQLVLKLEKLRLIEAAQEQYKGWLHEVVWERASFMPKHAELTQNPIDPAAWRKDLETAAERVGLASYDRWLAEFDELCAAWVAEAFAHGGFPLAAGRSFAADEVIQTLGVAQEHVQLAARLLEILVEFDYLDLENGQYQALGKGWQFAEADVERLAAASYPEIAWARQTSRQLLPLLRGEVNPVDALFADGGQQIATRLYRESAVARTFQPGLAFAAKAAAERLGGKARVLEVGGGTAATTSYLIPALGSSISEYVWTDIGAGFASAARREFAGQAAMRFQTLDLERDPAEQGLAGELFDIVVASNVIHATADIRQTLRYLRSLMHPGGVLLMMETVGKRQPWVDLTVGFTDGWWRFTDRELRPDYALLSRTAWITVLEDEGFGAVELAPNQAAADRAGEESTWSRQCLIAAVASDQTRGETARVDIRPVLIVTAEAENSRSLVDSLRAEAELSGAVVTVASVESASQGWVQDWFRRAEQFGWKHDLGAPAEIFYLAGAETAPIPDHDDGEQALLWQDRVLGGALTWTQSILAAERQVDCRLWLVGQGAYGPERGDEFNISNPDGATLAGFARSVLQEYPEAQVLAVDLNINAGGLWALSQNDLAGEAQIAIREESAWVPRLVPRQFAKAGLRGKEAVGADEVQRLYFSGTGLLEDLKLRTETRQTPGSGEVEIAIRATAINFHEVLSALDADAPHDGAPGGECVGIVARVGEGVDDLQPGDSVVAIGTGLMADFATLTRNRMWKKPDGMSDGDSATLLIPFLTARWCLERVARLQPGERVLIHSGAGGVGLAAIQEARRLGALVMATAGSEEKRAYLRGIGVEHVFDSRSTLFEGEVLAATGFLGADVVLNSLGGDKIAAGLRTLAPGGRFVELGEKTAMTDAEAKAIRPDVRYERVHLRAALVAAAPEVRETIETILADVESGSVQPLPWTPFPMDNPAEGFRFMATGQQTGRVLLTVGPMTLNESGRPKFTGFRRDGAYVVTGGFAGLGLMTVEWLAQQGAGCVLALGRSEPTVEAREVFERIRRLGTTAVAVRCDVSEYEPLLQALRMIPAEFVLRGIFHSAGALDDAGIPQQTVARFRKVLSAKVAGAWNLHRLTEREELDCFVLFSSAAGVLGARGLSNHASANAYMDALAHYRRERLGLTALSINWGAWSGAGAAVRHDVVSRSESMGAQAIAPADGLRLLGRLIEEDCTQVMVSKVDWRKWTTRTNGQAVPNRDLLTHVLARHQNKTVASGSAKATRFDADIAGNSGLPGSSGGKEGESQQSWLGQLLAAPEVRQRAMLDGRVEERVRAVLSLSASQSLDSLRPLQEYGLDSLLSIELRNALTADLEIKLPATVLFDYPTMESLTDWLFQDVLKLGAKQTNTDVRSGENPVGSGGEASQLAGKDLAELSDDEVEKLFQQKMAGMRK
jgi:acyl transferase domain-containing protein/NADPH:quinone reductase-like Zn-dependent oxidoreductase/NAD(P)-dependent dehydrogenase (short-subunit alcohol dehydrogenase family)/acyl carrier protein